MFDRPKAAATSPATSLASTTRRPARTSPSIAHLPPLRSATEEPNTTPPNDGLIADGDRRTFLQSLRAAIHAAATEELRGTEWTADQCPYIEYWFAYYGRRSAKEIEAALRKYAPASKTATNAREYIEPTVERVRAAIARWRTTAEVEAPTLGVPEVAAGLGSGEPLADHEAGTSPPDTIAPDALGLDALQARMGHGRPLDSHVRTRMEHAFGRDLSDIHVHTGAEAAALARQHDARAVTLGTNVGFANAQYRPGTLTGDLLIAHEIAHALQQSAATAYATTSDSRFDEAHADVAAGTAVARLAGVDEPRPAMHVQRGLALRRCNMNPVPREFDDEHQYEFQQGHELKQKSWQRQFDRDHGDLKNKVLDPGPRDEGIPTDTGVRIPSVRGHFLKPRPFYEHRFAAFFAYQGAIHYAELIEAGQLSAAQAIANETFSSYGEPVPHDKHLHLEQYVHWSYLAKQTSENLQGSLMLAEGVKGVTEMALYRPPTPRGAVGGEPVPNVAKGEIDVEAAKPPTSRGDVGGKAVPNVAKGEINTEPAPEVKPTPISPKHGYTGPWPPPKEGPRPPATATEAEMADWRYRRYVRDRFEEGKLPHEILTPEGYAPHAKTAATPGARPGRGGGEAQKGVREGPAAEAGYKNTETVQLGERWNPKKQRMEKNMVDGYKPNEKGGTDYLEVDKINKNGLPHAGYRDKLKTEIDALKPGDSLEFWDKTDPSQRIRYEYGDSPSVVDTRTAKTVSTPDAPTTPK